MLNLIKRFLKALLDHLLNVCMWLEEEEYGGKDESLDR